MERKFRYGISYGRCLNGMEWKISRIKWKTLFRTRFLELHLQKKHIRMSSSDKQYCRRSILLQYLRVLFVDKSRYFGCVYSADSVRIARGTVLC